jgi:hypothetical protein
MQLGRASHPFSLGNIRGLILLITLPILSGIAQPPSMTSIAKDEHCSEIRGNPDNSALACLVWDGSSERFAAPRVIDIYLEGGKSLTIDPGAPIREWHFWNSSKQLAIHFGEDGDYALYDVATGNPVQQISGIREPQQVPQWAKSRSQVEDESVPESPADEAQRTLWIAKLMRSIATIRPGLKRRDLDALLTTEGGISTRLQKTYVSRECPYIKVDIQFNAGAGTAQSGEESSDDIIESVSKPYLAWSVSD